MGVLRGSSVALEAAAGGCRCARCSLPSGTQAGSAMGLDLKSGECLCLIVPRPAVGKRSGKLRHAASVELALHRVQYCTA